MQLPTFSVIVPTYRRPQKLAQCLSSLARQTRAASDFEVIVVDDAAIRAELEPITARAGLFTCRLLSQSRRGAAAARNEGAKAASGRLLAFTDDDCQPAPDWLDSLERRMNAEPGPALIGGRVINALRDDPYATASQALIDFLYEQFNREPRQARLLTSNNLCLPAAAFRELGGFDTAFSGAGGEDREFCMRWAHAGHPLIYAPDAVVHHAHDMTLKAFLRQHYAYGRGAALLRQRAAAHGYASPPLERASFYWELFRYPQRVADLDARLGQSVLFALSQVANVAGYFHARAREPRSAPERA